MIRRIYDPIFFFFFDTQSQDQNTRFRSITDCFYCIVVEEVIIFLKNNVLHTSLFLMILFLKETCVVPFRFV